MPLFQNVSLFLEISVYQETLAFIIIITSLNLLVIIWLLFTLDALMIANFPIMYMYMYTKFVFKCGSIDAYVYMICKHGWLDVMFFCIYICVCFYRMTGTNSLALNP